MPDLTDIYPRVASVLADTLNVDAEDVCPGSTLQGDLGAESIDFLDIVFRLERDFGIRISTDELFPESMLEGNPDFVREGRVTPTGLEELRARLPFADLSRFEQDPRVSAIGDLFTVDLVARYIQRKLEQPATGHAGAPGR
jgi:acyl carrier protein